MTVIWHDNEQVQDYLLSDGGRTQPFPFYDLAERRWGYPAICHRPEKQLPVLRHESDEVCAGRPIIPCA